LSGIFGSLIWIVRAVGWLVLAVLIGPSKADNANSIWLSIMGGGMAWVMVSLGFVDWAMSSLGFTEVQPFQYYQSEYQIDLTFSRIILGGIVFVVVMALDLLDNFFSHR
jgi:hypothetical protein